MKVAVSAAVTSKPNGDSHPELCQLFCNRGPTKGLKLFWGHSSGFPNEFPRLAAGGLGYYAQRQLASLLTLMAPDWDLRHEEAKRDSGEVNL